MPGTTLVADLDRKRALLSMFAWARFAYGDSRDEPLLDLSHLGEDERDRVRAVYLDAAFREEALLILTGVPSHVARALDPAKRRRWAHKRAGFAGVYVDPVTGWIDFVRRVPRAVGPFPLIDAAIRGAGR